MASDDDDLQRLTVRDLRERAVKSLGARASALKTKAELIEALRVPSGAIAKIAVEAPPVPVARDFFVDPRKPALPTAYGDDRLLVFRREPLAVVVSWDLSDKTWGDGQGVWLELMEPRGKLIARSDVSLQTGLATFEGLPERKAMVPQLVRHGRVMTRGRAFSLGPLIDDVAQYQLTVAWDEPLPKKASQARQFFEQRAVATTAPRHVVPQESTTATSSRVDAPPTSSRVTSSRVA